MAHATLNGFLIYVLLLLLLLGVSVVDICYASWNDAKFDIIQNDDGIPAKLKLQLAAEHLSPNFSAVRIDTATQEGYGLPHNWTGNAEFDPGYVYMVKTFARDVYEPPWMLYHNSYQDEDIYQSFLPGHFEVGVEIVIKLKPPPDNWSKFAVIFIDKRTNRRPYKLKVWNDHKQCLFCYEIVNQEQDIEVNDVFPFASDVMSKLTFRVTKNDTIEMDVDDSFYHSYVTREDFTTVDTLAIWFEGIPDRLFLYSLDVHFPSLISD